MPYEANALRARESNRFGIVPEVRQEWFHVVWIIETIRAQSLILPDASSRIGKTQANESSHHRTDQAKNDAQILYDELKARSK